jgi:5'-3' exonuclease
MNLLGNDFVPHGMVLKINDEGIETVLGILKVKGLLLIDPTTMKYNRSVFEILVSELVREEEHKLIKGIRRKLNSRVGASAANSTDAAARAVAQMNDAPIEWAAEKCLVELKRLEGMDKQIWHLRPDWRSEYQKEGLWGADETTVSDVFCKTLGWTLEYYLGKPVGMSWYYPWLLPPTFQSLYKYLQKHKGDVFEAPANMGKTITATEQLAMVLPATSFSLLPTGLQTLPSKYPHAWPSAWDYFSLGRRFMWECEPLIPLIQPAQIKKWIEECLEDEE